MKHIYKGLVLCATLAFAYTHTAAQEPLADMLEATQADTLSKVQVAFRSIDQRDLLGGVSVIDMKEMSEKAYTSNSFGFVDNVVKYRIPRYRRRYGTRCEQRAPSRDRPDYAFERGVGRSALWSACGQRRYLHHHQTW